MSEFELETWSNFTKMAGVIWGGFTVVLVFVFANVDTRAWWWRSWEFRELTMGLWIDKEE